MAHLVKDLFFDSPTCEVISMVGAMNCKFSYSSPSSSGMGSVGSGNNLNQEIVLDITDSNQQHIYEDIIDNQLPPPKITPVSGILGKGKVVIRPIAFKPVVQNNSSSNGSRTPSHLSHLSSIHNESDRLKHYCRHHYNHSQSSSEDNRSMTYSESFRESRLQTPASYASSLNLLNGPGGSVLHLEDFSQTPSPSDSGVAELEAMLREKDSEINYLRETMEHNEQVIFKVYEEKEHGWQKEIKKLKQHYDAHLKATQLKANMLYYQLQQEKHRLKQECDTLKREREGNEQQTDAIRTELEVVRAQLEETEWALCQKTGEIALLKCQLKELHLEHSTRANELVGLKVQLKEAKIDTEKKKIEAKGLRKQMASLHYKPQLDKPFSNLDIKNSDLVYDLKEELAHLRCTLNEYKLELENQRERFKEEKVQWLEEKEKVIRYQKQLQLNYVQIYRRSRMLETEIEHLNLELEGREINMISATVNESHC